MPIKNHPAISRAICLLFMIFPWLSQPVFGGYTTVAELYGPEFRLSLNEAQALHEKAEALYCKGDYTNAFHAIDAARQLTERTLGKEHRDMAVINQTMTEGYLTLGDLPQATTFLERSLSVCQKTLGTNDPVLARTLKDMAVMNLLSGNLSMAETNINLCLKIQESVYPTNHPALSPPLIIRSMLRLRQGKYADALSDLNRSSAIVERALSRDSFLYGQNLHALAIVRLSQGDYATAQSEAEQGLAILEKTFGTEHIDLLACLSTLSNIYAKLGRNKEATEISLRNLAILEKYFGTNYLQSASVLMDLGTLSYNQGNYLKAFEYNSRSFRIFANNLGYYTAQTAVLNNNMGLCCLAADDLDGAKWLFKKSLEVSDKIGRPNNAEIATTLNNLALLCDRQKDYESAAMCYERSLQVQVDLLGIEHPGVATTLENIALFYAHQGMVEESLKAFVLMFRGQRSYFIGQLFGLSGQDAISMMERSFYSKEGFHSLCADAIFKDPHSSLIAGVGAEQLVLNKALLEEVQARQAALEAVPQTATRELRERYQTLQTELLGLAETEVDPTKRNVRRQELSVEMNQIEAKLAERGGAFAESVRDRNLSLFDIARSLPSQSALVDFIQYRRYDFAADTNQWKERRYAAYLTFPLIDGSTNVFVERVDLGEAAPINDAVELVCKRMSAGAIRRQDLSVALQQLSDLVYAPLARHLTNASHLIICPDGQLSRVPFEMLPVGNKFLVEEKTISYVTSGREIVRLTKPNANAPSSKSVVMGNPDFNFDLANARLSHPPIQLASAPSVLRSLSRDYDGIKFKPLPGAEAEARSVTKLLGDNVVLYLGADAREVELKAVQSPRVLHLATHGFYFPDQEFNPTNLSAKLDQTRRLPYAKGNNNWENPMVRCGIALAGANHARQITNALAENGLLTGLDASLLNLQGTELVILSACDSGTGEVRIGEGVMSLRRAFLIAGAQTVLASHWNISDKATGRLMTEFMHRRQAGESRAAAWRETQLSLLHSKDFSNPYFWAAFTLTGQWQ
jgi:CHAT domain-containing protein/Tfp pilus assembly protein PilF